MAESDPTPEQSEHEEKTARRGRRTEAEPQASAQATAPPDLPVSQLIEDARTLTGHSRHVAAGALRDHEPDEMLSIDAAKKEIEDWLKQPVEVAGEEK